MSTDTDGIIDADDTKRFLLEVLENAGGLSKDELEKAYKQLVDLAVSAAMFSLWQAGDVTLSWNGPTQDLIWIHKDAAA